MTRRTTRRITALLASLTLALAAGVVGTGPAAAGEASALHVAAHHQAAGPEGSASADVADVQDEEEPITVDDLRHLVAQFEDTGEVTFAGARRLEILLLFVENHIDRGTPAGAIDTLERFKQIASTPRYVPSESARDQLIAAADQLIAQIRDTL